MTFRRLWDGYWGDWGAMPTSFALVPLVVALAVFQSPAQPQRQSERDHKPSNATSASVAELLRPDEQMAEYTFWLTIFAAASAGLGALQWYTSYRQRRIMDRQTQLMSEQFRPRLDLRRVFFGDPQPNPHIAVELADTGYGGVLIGDYAAVIVGSAPNHVPEPWRIIQALDASVLHEITVPVRGSRVIQTNFAAGSLGEDDFFTHAEQLYVVGYVRYADANRRRQHYRLGFVRIATRGNRTFQPTDALADFQYSE